MLPKVKHNPIVLSFLKLTNDIFVIFLSDLLGKGIEGFDCGNIGLPVRRGNGRNLFKGDLQSFYFLPAQRSTSELKELLPE